MRTIGYLFLCAIVLGCGTRKINLEKKETQLKTDSTHNAITLIDSTTHKQNQSDSTSIVNNHYQAIKNLSDSLKNNIETNKVNYEVTEKYDTVGRIKERKIAIHHSKKTDFSTKITKQNNNNTHHKKDSTTLHKNTTDSLKIKKSNNNNTQVHKNEQTNTKQKIIESVKSYWWLIVLIISAIIGWRLYKKYTTL